MSLFIRRRRSRRSSRSRRSRRRSLLSVDETVRWEEEELAQLLGEEQEEEEEEEEEKGSNFLNFFLYSPFFLCKPIVYKNSDCDFNCIPYTYISASE